MTITNGERYLSDHVLAASFSDAEVVGKGLYFMYFEAVDTTALRQAIPEHTFTSSVTTGGTLFIRTDVCREIPFDSISLKEDTNFQRAAARAGCRVYSADRFNSYGCVQDGQSIIPTLLPTLSS